MIGQMVRILRQARTFSAVSSPADEAGYITFTNVDDVTEEFRLNAGTGEIEYGQPGSLSALAGPRLGRQYSVGEYRGHIC